MFFPARTRSSAMPHKLSVLPTPWQALLVLAAMVLVPVAQGCGRRVPYPVPKVTSSLGREAICAHCSKKIQSVREENLVVIDGVQYIVCDQGCANGVREWLRKLDER